MMYMYEIVTPNAASAMMKIFGPKPNVLYRFMDPAHVDAFCAGEPWLSTIVICREAEDGRQDQEEGTDTAEIYADRGAGAPAGFRRAFDVPDDAIVFASSYTRALLDAHVLCFSRQFEPAKMTGKYGKACVEINDPLLFGETLTDHLMQMPLHDIRGGGMGPVMYLPTRSRPHNSPAPPLGFVKPCVPYEPDQEYRMRWWLNSGKAQKPLARITDVNCPALADLCKRIA